MISEYEVDDAEIAVDQAEKAVSYAEAELDNLRRDDPDNTAAIELATSRLEHSKECLRFAKGRRASLRDCLRVP